MKYSPGQQRVEAIYSKVQNPLHQGNPLIEALPESKSKETLAAGLRMEIPFSEEQLQYPPEVRADLVGALNHYFAPWELHLALAQEIRSAICDGEGISGIHSASTGRCAGKGRRISQLHLFPE